MRMAFFSFICILSKLCWTLLVRVIIWYFITLMFKWINKYTLTFGCVWHRWATRAFNIHIWFIAGILLFPEVTPIYAVSPCEPYAPITSATSVTKKYVSNPDPHNTKSISCLALWLNLPIWAAFFFPCKGKQYDRIMGNPVPKLWTLDKKHLQKNSMIQQGYVSTCAEL